ncbi:hypothetical protein [Gordonia oryzae]|uniref:hypothetical protein n=1 Tax=Gordonia oryzae TaxID=2487349 RepID=UPI0016162E9B|nr:hypothetical protein [Gordonia oryzae]
MIVDDAIDGQSGSTGDCFGILNNLGFEIDSGPADSVGEVGKVGEVGEVGKVGESRMRGGRLGVAGAQHLHRARHVLHRRVAHPFGADDQDVHAPAAMTPASPPPITVADRTIIDMMASRRMATAAKIVAHRGSN